MAQTVKSLPAMQEIRVQSLGQEDSLEQPLSILTWEITGIKESGGLQVHVFTKSQAWLSD